MTDSAASPQMMREVNMSRIALRLAARFALLSSLVAALGACVMDVDVGQLAADPRALAGGPFRGPIDILFVVDNSGSMAEEHARLAEALWGDDCPITDLNAVPQALTDPDDETRAALTERCGLAQMLAAYDRDFHIGVITTDVNACDNVFPPAMGGEERGFRPQRGCLQPEPMTGAKVLTRADQNLARSFLRVLEDLDTWGSPWERGLDAAQIFLEGGTWTGPGCEGDRALFLREDAELFIVFVTDEDDCSHFDSTVMADVATSVCGADPEHFTAADPRTCYDHPELLNPVADTVERLRALKGGRPVRAALIGGAATQQGVPVGQGCLYAQDGVESTSCYESGGLSNFSAPGGVCAADTADARGGLPCCTADAAHRYVALRDALGGEGFSASSICAHDYRVDLLEAAIAAQFPDIGGAQVDE